MARFIPASPGKSKAPLTKGKWEVYKGIGKLSSLKGSGTFVVKPSDKHGEFVLEMEGNYEL